MKSDPCPPAPRLAASHPFLRAAAGVVLILGMALPAPAARAASAREMDLSGAWQVSLADPASPEASWREIRLPGTLDDAGIGKPLTLDPVLDLQVLTRLQRKFTYVGRAWYRRTVEIPADWAGLGTTLELERVLWESRAWVDGRAAGSSDSLTTPHRHEFGDVLAPGRHELVICIDNSEIYPGVSHHARAYTTPEDAPLAHSYTNHTQVIWNGVLGTIRLVARGGPAPESIAVFPRLQPQAGLRVTARIPGGDPGTVELRLRRLGDHRVLCDTRARYAGNGAFEFDWQLPPGLRVDSWDEFSPALYEVEAAVEGGGAVRASFGFRELRAENAEFRMNSRRIFLRGDLECCIFPLTGYPPTDVAAWKRLFGTAKEWGLNHIRFHSWCPPEAAFAAADDIGLYLQIELPHWSLEVGKDAPSWAFEQNEARRILAEYGNHPSFMFLSMGNELQGDMGLLNGLVRQLQARDPRRLYTSTTFTFEPGHGRTPEPPDDYFVTQYTKDGWVRGQGVFNEQSPAFDGDYRAASAAITVPLVQHEVGQYAVYPDLSEIGLYKGNLVPLNFMAIRRDLERKGLLSLAPRFTEASGRFAALLYKEEIERALRTPQIDGFQLLELQDFPGQGTALVGLLDAFWKPKGFIEASEFRQWCSPVVPLARFPKAVYEQGEDFTATVEVADFMRDLPHAVVRWTVGDERGRQIQSGDFGPVAIAGGGTTKLGRIQVPIPPTGPAARWTLQVTVEGTPFKNRWNIWIYPHEAAPIPEGVHYSDSLSDALASLRAGQRVLFAPPLAQITGIEGKFVPVFWSPVHFPNQPGTMGILCDPAHPALADFPTEDHSDWQWWDPALHSRSVILDGLNASPIVRVIDNFNRNHSLASVFEAQVGEGRLIFCAVDIATDLDHRPVTRQLRNSLLRYASGARFAPASKMTPAELTQLLKPAPAP